MAVYALRAAPSAMTWSLGEVASAIGGRIVRGDPSMSIDTVSTDSRDIPPGSLFFALRGASHDGHAFVGAAIACGAVGAVVSGDIDARDGAVLRVEDTERALGDLAAHVRRQARLLVMALTGSNGKTTTKEMLASICQRRWPGVVLKTQGNRNNLIGLPLTLLGWRGERVAVLEMGMNRAGEIARLAEIASPDCGAVLNVAQAHLEGLGSLEAVAAAKGELFAGLPPSAIAVVNTDDPWVMAVATRFRGRTVGFGSSGIVRAVDVVDLGLDGLAFTLRCEDRSVRVRLRLPGRHNIVNATAAAAMAWACGIGLEEIAGGLEDVRPVPMRMEVNRLRNGVTLINDSYNANPGSMGAALEALASLPGRSLAVFGEMRELGVRSVDAHRRLGERASSLGIDLLVVVGSVAEEIAIGAHANGMRADAIVRCQTHEEAAEAVRAQWRAGDTVLVKGSRGAQMDRVVALLEEAGNCP